LLKHIFKNIIPPVELGKEDEEQDGVPPNPVGENNWVVTFNKEELESVHHQTHKLDLYNINQINIINELTFYRRLNYIYQLNSSEISLAR